MKSYKGLNIHTYEYIENQNVLNIFIIFFINYLGILYNVPQSHLLFIPPRSTLAPS